jgi:hypothetical protein
VPRLLMWTWYELSSRVTFESRFLPQLLASIQAFIYPQHTNTAGNTTVVACSRLLHLFSERVSDQSETINFIGLIANLVEQGRVIAVDL